jgi:hypothetical protein
MLQNSYKHFLFFFFEKGHISSLPKTFMACQIQAAFCIFKSQRFKPHGAVRPDIRFEMLDFRIL